MHAMGCIHDERNEHEQAVEWYTEGAEAGLPQAKFNLGICLEKGEGVAAPDYPAAADWYRRAAEADHGGAANNLANLYALGRGRVGRAEDVCHVILPHCSPSFLELDGGT